MHADEKVSAFVELEAAIRARQGAQGIQERINKVRQIVADHVQASSITSSDVSTYLQQAE